MKKSRTSKLNFKIIQNISPPDMLFSSEKFIASKESPLSNARSDKSKTKVFMGSRMTDKQPKKNPLIKESNFKIE